MPRPAQPVDPQESLQHLLGAELRHWRSDVRCMGLRELASQAFVDFSQLAKWERGDRPVPADAVRRLDEALHANRQLIALHDAVTELEDLRMRALRGEQPSDGSEQPHVDETRRRLLRSLAALGATSVPAAALEPVRQALTSALPDTGQSTVPDWEEIAAEYGHAFLTTPAVELLPDIAADVVALQNVMRNSDAWTSRALCQPGGQMAMLMALMLGCLGEKREARHWWQTARHTADHSGDLSLRVWVRGYEAMLALYERRPLHVIVSRANEAIAIAGASRCPAVLEAMAARAQALAGMAQPRMAKEALRDLETVYEAQPAISPYDRLSRRNWPEVALRHTQSWVYAYIGDPAATEAQEAALSLYPPEMRRQAAQIKLLQSVSLVRGGHINEGVEYARQAVEALPTGYRTMGIQQSAHDVLALVPDSETGQPAVAQYRDYLALAAGQS